MLKGCLRIIDALVEGDTEPLKNDDFGEDFIDIVDGNKILSMVGSLPTTLYFKFHSYANKNHLRHNKMTIDPSQTFSLIRSCLESQMDNMAFSVNDSGEWQSRVHRNTKCKIEREHLLSHSLYNKRQSYTFLEFIDEMHFAYKALFGLDRICWRSMTSAYCNFNNAIDIDLPSDVEKGS